jgi:hypothetical protein
VSTDTTSRVRELRTALESKAADIEGMAGSWRDETGNGQFALSTEEYNRYTAAVAEAKAIQDAIVTEEQASGIFEFLNAPGSTPVAGTDSAASAHQRFQVKDLGSMFVGSEEYKAAAQAGWRDPRVVFAIDSGINDLARAAQVKDVYSAQGGTIAVPGLGSAQNLGWTERMLRPGRVRDLFPAESTQASILYGMRETGYTNNARVVRERTASDGTAPTGGGTDVYGLKPKSEITVVPVTYPIATIAHIMYVHKNTLADEPRLQGLLNRDMVDGVKMAEDTQLLYGDGVGDNLTGIMNTTGIQSYTGLNSDKRSAQVRRAATKAILAFFQPTGIVMHPYDWEDVELETDLNGNYTVAISVAVGGEKRLWRLNVVDTPAINEGTALIGAFGTGAKVYDREQVNVAISTENRDLFERNAVTLRAEERVGLVVDRPESFVKLTITTPV